MVAFLKEFNSNGETQGMATTPQMELHSWGEQMVWANEDDYHACWKLVRKGMSLPIEAGNVTHFVLVGNGLLRDGDGSVREIGSSGIIPPDFFGEVVATSNSLILVEVGSGRIA